MCSLLLFVRIIDDGITSTSRRVVGDDMNALVVMMMNVATMRRSGLVGEFIMIAQDCNKEIHLPYLHVECGKTFASSPMISSFSLALS